MQGNKSKGIFTLEMVVHTEHVLALKNMRCSVKERDAVSCDAF